MVLVLPTAVTSGTLIHVQGFISI